MRTTRHTLANCGLMVTGVLCLLLSPGRGAAENLLVRNESPMPVVVQAAGVVQGSLRRGRPVLLNPKDVAPAIVLPGNKILTVYDARAPNRILFQGVITGSPMDQFIAVVPGAPAPKMRLEARRSFR